MIIHKLQNAKKILNLQHSLLCNVVEKTFNILKQCFQIFHNIFEYTIDIQCNWVYIFVVIYNFLIEEKILLLGIEDFELNLEEINANLDVFSVFGFGKSSKNKKKAQEMNVL